MSDDYQARVRKFFESLPGQRGKHIPAPTYDKILAVASGITYPLWGRPPTPEMMQHMYDNGLHEPAQIHAFFDEFDHPNAPGVKVGEYQDYAHAYETYEKSR